MKPYRLFGAEMSPYSVKVRSVLRYKQLPHEWIVRSLDQMEEFNRYARLPLIPLLVDGNDQGLQDSTPIIEKLDQLHPQPSLLSGDATVDFLSALLEEFADEWLNKPMFHMRWHYAGDADSSARRIVDEIVPAATDENSRTAMATAMRERMIGRLGFVGSSAETAPLIERSFHECSQLLEQHLQTRPFLFGGRPLMADFGLYGQYKELLSDPTAGAWLREHCPRVCDYVARMEAPEANGGLENLEALLPTLLPLLQHVGRWFVPWTRANAAALAAGQTEFSVTLDGAVFTQQPQKYHARSWLALQQKFSCCADNEALCQLLQQADLLAALQS